MKIAILSSARSGGAGIAAVRVKAALQDHSPYEVDFLDSKALGERLPEDCSPAASMTNGKLANTHFTVEYPGFIRGWLIDLLSDYDALNIHWATGLIGLSEIYELGRRGTPLLFTCHDFYYFSGGCHYPAGCLGNLSGCYDCPQIDRSRCDPEVISSNLKLKKKIFNSPIVDFAAPSRFLVSRAQLAGLVEQQQAHVLRNPYEPEAGIHRANTEEPIQIVLVADSFGERRKAMPLALESLAVACGTEWSRSVHPAKAVLHVIGALDDALERQLDTLPMQVVKHGRTSEHRDLAGILASCHVLLTCSYEDNWPNVLVEAGAYGVVPVVGPGHGCEEFVNECGGGYIAKEYTASSFAEAISAAIDGYNFKDRKGFEGSVRAKHAPAKVAAEYQAVFRRLLRRAGKDVHGSVA
ncbi:MAG: glycosyltransferase [Candidatus Wenzhouxiangella sp. M2_3B_020]